MFRNTSGTLLVQLLTSVVLLLTSARAHAGSLAPPDAIDLSQAAVYNSPGDIASWPVTGAITTVTMAPNGTTNHGVSFAFTTENAWPDYTPPGWTGPLEYTVWAVVKVNGQWNTSGFVQMWRGRPSTGAPMSDFANNWAYDARWGPMNHYQPQVGEQVGFFLSAGNARGVTSVTSVRERTNVVVVSLPANDTGVFTFRTRGSTLMDIDGDGKADISVYRRSSGKFLGLASSTNYATGGTVSWGISGDIPVPGDYDGDGKTDVAVYRPSGGGWFILESSTNYTVPLSYQFGMYGDIPAPGDYDGDGKTDLAVFRPSNGVWYILLSSTNFSASVSYQFGANGDIPTPGDYDGDGRSDVAIYRPSDGVWAILASSTNYSKFSTYQWGAGGDIPVPSDYDGDGRTDIAVYRPSNGGWYILQSNANYSTSVFHQWGQIGDVPVPSDYDGDGKTDLAVYRPSNGGWYLLLSSANYSTSAVYQLGISGDTPLSSTFNASASWMSGSQVVLDSPSPNSTVGHTLAVGGWAIDLTAAGGTGVDGVHVWAYPADGSAPQFLGVATYGLARPDIGGIFGSQFTNSGYLLNVAVNPGTYQIVAFAHSAVRGAFKAVAAPHVTVQAPVTTVVIDTPGQNVTTGRPFTLSGWAVDQRATTGTGIDAIDVWAFPTSGVAATFVGAATYGSLRSDVGSLLGNSQFSNSGYSLSITSANLPVPGAYDLVVFGRSTFTGSFTVARVVRVSVQ
jgi:hypothetical protein